MPTLDPTGWNHSEQLDELIAIRTLAAAIRADAYITNDTEPLDAASEGFDMAWRAAREGLFVFYGTTFDSTAFVLAKTEAEAIEIVRAWPLNGDPRAQDVAP